MLNIMTHVADPPRFLCSQAPVRYRIGVPQRVLHEGQCCRYKAALQSGATIRFLSDDAGPKEKARKDILGQKRVLSVLVSRHRSLVSPIQLDPHQPVSAVQPLHTDTDHLRSLTDCNYLFRSWQCSLRYAVVKVRRGVPVASPVKFLKHQPDDFPHLFCSITSNRVIR